MSPQPTDGFEIPQPPPPRIVGWHLERDPNRPCEVCRLKPAFVLVDFGDGCPTNACEDCRPADAYDEIAEIFAQAVRAHPAS